MRFYYPAALVALVLATIGVLPASGAVITGSTPADYRKLALELREQSSFKVPLLSGDIPFRYELNWGDFKWPEPITANFGFEPGKKKYFRSFFEKIFMKPGSFIEIGSERLPLTCIFVDGQDNRFAGLSMPALPNLILKVYAVANDFACDGPINQGFPENGGKQELWDSYIYFEVRDPTVMLPTHVKLRYRWNEYDSVLVDAGH